jgi:exosortase
MLLTLGGLVLLLFGPRVFGFTILPIAYLGFAVTISERVMIEITFRLQLLAARGSWILLNMLGIDTDIEGNVLNVFQSSTGEMHPLNVAEACSGMRMVIAFIALAGAMALFSVTRWWKRVALVLLAVPVAVLMNVIRVAVLGLLTLVDPDLASGDAHMLIGTVLLVPAFGLFLLGGWIINKVEPEEARA